MAGYVYLIGTPIFGWYKIGKSVNPEIRIQDLGILLPFKIKVIGIWKAENHSLLENLLHEKCAKNRINGEWFRFSGKEVYTLFSSLPNEVRIFPTENSPDSIFAKFSNIESDCPEGQILHFSIKKDKRAKLFSKEEQIIVGQFCKANKHLPKEERRELILELIRRKKLQQQIPVTSV